jgi:hypothetical protein
MDLVTLHSAIALLVVKSGEVDQARIRVQNYIMKNMPDGIRLFLGPCQKHSNEGRYKLYEDWIKAFFGTQELFIEEVKSYSSYYGVELDNFMGKVKESSPFDCAVFEFKNLPIAKIATGKIY